MPTELSVSFADVEGARGTRIEGTLSTLPALLGEALVDCDLGLVTSLRTLVAVLRVRGPRCDPASVERVRFWCARAGGTVVPLAAVAVEDGSGLAACDVQHPNVPPARLARALRGALGAIGVAAPARAPWPPVLELAAGGAGWDALEYDRAADRLFVPGALAPAVGDRLILSVRAPSGAPTAADARVVAVRGADDAGPGAPAGFFLEVEPGGEALRSALAGACPPPRVEPGQRASARHAVGGLVRFRSLPEPASPSPAHDGVLENLSRGGAFVRAAVPLEVGTELDVLIRIAREPGIAARATVAHSGPSGFGVRFEPSPELEARLDAILARLPGRARRVLVVDDDALARRMIADAFEQAGFDVLTAAGALGGLRTLAEELLTLDLLVTDVVMEGMSGEDLIRRIRHVANEPDLPILAVSASLAAGARTRLLDAGADGVALKALGAPSLVRAAEALLERERSDAGSPPAANASRRVSA